MATVIAAFAVAMIAGAASAAAFSAPTYSSSFGSSGTGNGQFAEPWGDAVDSSGNVWVVDKGNNRVQKFNSKGEFLCKVGSTGSGNGQFSGPRGVAADSSGNVWVVDTGNNRLEKIGPSCEYLSQLGSKGSGNGQLSNAWRDAVDSSGNIWVSDRGNSRIEEFNSKGEFMASCGSHGSEPGKFELLQAIVSDADGNVWVGDEEHGMQEFNSKCEYVGGFDQASAGAPDWFEGSVATIDPSGNVWVASESGERHVQGFYPEGEYVTHFGESGSGAGQFGVPGGIAAGSDGTLWLVDRSHNRVEKWVPGTPDPVVTGRAALIKRTEATLTGSINPGGTATSYQFEYGTSPSFGSVIPASPKAIGSGSSPVAVSQALSGLKTASTYYYRVVATTEKSTTYGATRHFKTLAAAGAGAVMRIGGKTFAELGISEAAFSLKGSFRIAFSNGVTYICGESGTGTLGSGGVKQEKLTLECSEVGNPECKVNSFWIKVDGSFHLIEPLYQFWIQGTNCWLSPEAIPVSEPAGSFEYGSEGSAMNVNSNATAHFSSYTVTLTGNSNWTLTGTNAGKTLGFW